jgi:uncharacterized membrane protein
LGLVEFLAPRGFCRLIGIRPHPEIIRLLGLRELASGISILTGRRTTSGIQARMAGDVMDLALLSPAFVFNRRRRGSVLLATTAAIGVTALDMQCLKELRGPSAGRKWTNHIKTSVLINRRPEELYRFWRNFESLPQFMEHLVSVSQTGENRFHWIAKGPAETQVQWDAEVVMDKPNELIAWRSLEGADVENAGSVRFEPAPGNQGTLMRVQLEYRLPGGTASDKMASLLGESPDQKLTSDLRRFKDLMEAGQRSPAEGKVMTR